MFSFKSISEDNDSPFGDNENEKDDNGFNNDYSNEINQVTPSNLDSEYQSVSHFYKNKNTLKIPPKPLSSVSDIGFVEIQNEKYRKTMEDSHCMIDKFRNNQNEAFFAIFDGHGGRETVNYLSKYFHQRFQIELEKKELSKKKKENEKIQKSSPSSIKNQQNNQNNNQNNQQQQQQMYDKDKEKSSVFKKKSTKYVRQAFVNTYKIVDAELKQNSMGFDNGATSVTCFITSIKVPSTNDPNQFKIKKKLFTGNCGDARCVLSRSFKAQRLTFDHKASEKNESERIKSSGGFVAYGRVNGILSVSRAFGDHILKSLVVSDPYYTEVNLSEKNDQFLILACDGIWDALNDQEAVDLVSKDFIEFKKKSKGSNSKIAQKMANKLVNKAIEKQSTDNISCMVVIL